MPDLNLDTTCPMCGRQVSTKLTTCPGCGERLDSDRGSDGVDPETIRDADFRTWLNLLGIIWIGWSLFRGCLGLFAMADGYSLYVSMSGPSLILVILLESLTWFVSGLAALQKEMWGVYLGYVFSYLLLLVNLIDLNPIGIFVAAGFILFARSVLKQYRQLQKPDMPSEDE